MSAPRSLQPYQPSCAVKDVLLDLLFWTTVCSIISIMFFLLSCLFLIISSRFRFKFRKCDSTFVGSPPVKMCSCVYVSNRVNQTFISPYIILNARELLCWGRCILSTHTYPLTPDQYFYKVIIYEDNT